VPPCDERVPEVYDYADERYSRLDRQGKLRTMNLPLQAVPGMVTRSSSVSMKSAQSFLLSQSLKVSAWPENQTSCISICLWCCPNTISMPNAFPTEYEKRPLQSHSRGVSCLSGTGTVLAPRARLGCWCVWTAPCRTTRVGVQMLGCWEVVAMVGGEVGGLMVLCGVVEVVA